MSRCALFSYVIKSNGMKLNSKNAPIRRWVVHEGPMSLEDAVGRTIDLDEDTYRSWVIRDYLAFRTASCLAPGDQVQPMMTGTVTERRPGANPGGGGHRDTTNHPWKRWVGKTGSSQ